jgi:hypothetical protein
VDWDLIERHLLDMLQVTQSIKAGCTSASTIVRKLGPVGRKKNKAIYKVYKSRPSDYEKRYILFLFPDYLSEYPSRNLLN